MQLNKAQKMVRMVEFMARRGGIRANELMKRFDLDGRSLRRYLSDIRQLDIPVRDEGRGDARIVSIDPQWRRTGVQLTLAEILSLHFGRELVGFLDGTSFAEDMSVAIERLQPAVSRAHADLARELEVKFMAVPEPAKTWTAQSSDVIDELVTAIVYDNVVDCRYRKVSGVESRKRLHPYTLATYRQGLYLFAKDVDQGEVRTYAVERFTELVRNRHERFERSHGWSPRAHIAHAFGIITASPVEVVVAFTTGVSAYIRERTWHPTQTFRTLRDGRLELRMVVGDTVELVNWVCGFGRDAEVLAPPELRERVAATLRDAVAHYEPAP